MSYNFDIVGVTPIWTFFKHQQMVEQSPHRSCAYVGSYDCTLDGFIGATDLIHQKPDWDWDAIISHMISFWMKDGDRLSQWKTELQRAEETSLVVGRIANFKHLRSELETLIDQ